MYLSLDSAKCTYVKRPGFTPMFGHVAESGQLVAVDFRAGNVSPAKDNLQFIQQCERALPPGVKVKAVRIDAAGYQSAIIEYCQQQAMDFVIRARMCASLRASCQQVPDREWQPLLNRKGKPTRFMTWRTEHRVGNSEKFTLVVLREPTRGQTPLDLHQSAPLEYATVGYRYRALATSYTALSDSEIVHKYNQRGETSENRIKELKLDFSGGTLPCSNFAANALYLWLSMLAYNLFVLLRRQLPKRHRRKRLPSLRKEFYQLAATVTCHAGRVEIKLYHNHCRRINNTLPRIWRLIPPPLPPPA